MITRQTEQGEIERRLFILHPTPSERRDHTSSERSSFILVYNKIKLGLGSGLCEIVYSRSVRLPRVSNTI